MIRLLSIMQRIKVPGSTMTIELKTGDVRRIIFCILHAHPSNTCYGGRDLI
jgi:hypothetical protein